MRLLQDHALFQTRDLDEARERVAAVFCPHRLEADGALDACHHHLPGHDLSLNYIEYGARTLIAPGELGRFYLLQVPLSGGAEIVNGAARYVSTPGQAAILNPHLPTRMTWEAGTRQVLVQVSRAAMEAQLAALLGPSERPLTFDGPLDLTKGPGAALRRLILWLVAETDAGSPPIGRGLMARQIESTILAGLLEAPHDRQSALSRQRAAPRPRHLRLAEGFIEAHLDQPITLEEVAQAAGISPRGLQMVFRQHRGTTPLGFWRDQRLARAHADLLQAPPGTRVTDVALRWGFTHFGRFSEVYRARYGLSPRDTLQARIGAGM
ncbi:AraC family transcriptional regulator [Stagnihabitans tardus]|uniref:Helix-turn-helix domain-containing protein n=1 Tax=Stagnihabitans tardus TaxID=2699202 RepID=A0AAE4Y7Q6_9RHOB|nr:AraC family transcriptional regulator [Stagnihabitans tardus]NBZ86366.1 helix-turn-helix domain-containing protein [Stagnihabitans tardus]